MHDRTARFSDAISLSFLDQLELAGRRAFEAGQFQRLGEADHRGHGVVGEFV